MAMALGGLAAGEMIRRVWSRFKIDDVLTRAAAMSFFMIFALTPAFLFLLTLLGLLPWREDVLERLPWYLRQVLPADAASLVEKTLVQLREGASPSLLSLGAGTALWAASSGMVSVINGLNVAYRVDEPRPWWRRRLVAIGLTGGLAIFMLTALILVVFGGWIGEAIADALGVGSQFTIAWQLLQWPVVIGCVAIGVGLVYRFAPARPLAWRWLAPGAIFAVAAWLTTSLGLRVYVTHFDRYNATYGSIGGVIILMLWLFLSNVVLLVGAEINSVIEEFSREAGRLRAPPRETPAPRPAG